MRHEEGAYAIIQKLLHRAALRLRFNHCGVRDWFVQVSFWNDKSWDTKASSASARDIH